MSLAIRVLIVLRRGGDQPGTANLVARQFLAQDKAAGPGEQGSRS